MDSVETRVAVLEADQKSHKSSDDERYGRIESSLTNLTNMVIDIGRKLDDGLRRSHELREQDISKVRHDSANAVMVVDAKIAKVDKRTEEVDDRISDLQSKSMAGAIALLIMVVTFFIVPFFTRH